MNYVTVEGLPAVGKSELLALLERFHPESVRVLPELVKEIVEREALDLFADRERLSAAIEAALPERRRRILEIVEQGFLCLEESHLGVHLAYSKILGDTGFAAAYDRLRDVLPTPDLYLRLELPVSGSVRRQAARGTPEYDIDDDALHAMLDELDRWHAKRSTPLVRLDADRPADAVVRDVVATLDLTYGARQGTLRNSFDVLLLLGRPASGKSEFIDFMRGLRPEERNERFHIAPFEVVDDFPILWERFVDDDIWEDLGRSRLHSVRCDSNYAVDDDGLWPFLIEKINRAAEPHLSTLDRRTLLVEFSRGGPNGYADALARMSPAILDRAAILYVSVSFEESWRRNVARYDAKKRDGILTHSVPREEMERTYGTDDWHAIAGAPHGTIDVAGQAIPYATMENEPESTDPAVLALRYAAALDPLHAAWRSKADRSIRSTRLG